MRLLISLVFIFSFSRLNAAAAPATNDYDALGKIFEDGPSSGAASPLSGFVLENSEISEIPVPLRPEIHPAEELFPGEELTVEQILESSEKGLLPGNFEALIEKQYGKPLKEGPDKEKIKAALALMGKSAVGVMMCRSVAYSCDLESIKKAGIEIRIKDTFTGNTTNALALVPNPVDVGGRYVMSIHRNLLLGDGVLNVDPFTIREIASVLTHEFSHVEDLKGVYPKEKTLSKVAFASEVKARFDGYLLYESIPGGDDEYAGIGSEYAFFTEVWKWKNEKGLPPPVVKDSKWDKLLKMPAKTFEDVLVNYIRMQYPKLKTVPSKDAKEMWDDIFTKLYDRMEDYRIWRISTGLYSPPAPAPQPAPNPAPTPNPVPPPPAPAPQPQPTPQPVPQPVPPPAPQPKPRLSVDRDSLTFYGQEEVEDPSSERFGIRNSGNGTLDWEVRSTASWLSLSPRRGSSTGETDYVTVEVDSGLSEGTYRGEITVSAGSFTHVVRITVYIEPFEIDIPGSSVRGK